MKEKWWAFPLGALVFLAMIYPIETAYLTAKRRCLGENPDHGLSFEDLALQSMERAFRLYRGGEISLYRLVIDIRSHYRSLGFETVSRNWKKQMLKCLDQLSKIDKVIFDSGIDRIPEDLQVRADKHVQSVGELISQARDSIERRFNE